MNRYCFFFSCLTLAACVFAGRVPRDAMPGPQADKQGYTSMFDKINLDMVLKSDRLLRSYFDCVMNRKPCTAEGSELKIILPDALKFGCSKCSENQREGIEKLINYLIANKPDIWKDLEDHLDPKGIYKQKSTTSAEKGATIKAE